MRAKRFLEHLQRLKFSVGNRTWDLRTFVRAVYHYTTGPVKKFFYVSKKNFFSGNGLKRREM